MDEFGGIQRYILTASQLSQLIGAPSEMVDEYVRRGIYTQRDARKENHGLHTEDIVILRILAFLHMEKGLSRERGWDVYDGLYECVWRACLGRTSQAWLFYLETNGGAGIDLEIGVLDAPPEIDAPEGMNPIGVNISQYIRMWEEAAAKGHAKPHPLDAMVILNAN